MYTKLLNTSLLAYFHFGLLFLIFTIFSLLKINSLLHLILPISFFVLLLFSIISLKTIWPFILYLTIFILSILVSNLFFDMSYDGKAYHQSAIYRLSKDFNPYFDILSKKDTQYYTYINHYPKVFEIVSSCIYAFTNKIQTAKCFNLIFIFSNIILGGFLIKKYLGFNKKLIPIMFSFIIALNPVVISQIFTFYVDGFMYSTIVALVYMIVLRIKTQSTLINISIFLLSVVLCNIKFTSLVYFFIIFFSAIGLFLLYNDKKSFRFLLKIGVLTFVFGIVFFGYNPYVTNYKAGNHIFYPIYGEEKIDIITNVSPTEFKGKNRFEKFAISFFGETGNIANSSNKLAPEKKFVKLKIPFSISGNELSAIMHPDIRISGFGPYFSGITLLALLGFIVYLLRRKQTTIERILCFIILSLVFSTIINPEFWWARFSPQFWLVPIVIAMILYLNKKSLVLKYFSLVTISIIFISIFLFLKINFMYNIKSSLRIAKNLNILKKSNEKVYVYQDTFETDFLKFSENKIQYEIVKSPTGAKYKNNLFGEITIYQNNINLYILLESLN